MLITKLRSANTAETRQYRKASKALLVLIPLFGLTYLIVLYGPNEGIGKKIFDIARAFLLSTQVLLLHYFLFANFLWRKFSSIYLFRKYSFLRLHHHHNNATRTRCLFTRHKKSTDIIYFYFSRKTRKNFPLIFNLFDRKSLLYTPVHEIGKNQLF